MVRVPAAADVAYCLAEGLANDGLLDELQVVFVKNRIQSVLEGERAEWRKLFEFYVAKVDLKEG